MFACETGVLDHRDHLETKKYLMQILETLLHIMKILTSVSCKESKCPPLPEVMDVSVGLKPAVR